MFQTDERSDPLWAGVINIKKLIILALAAALALTGCAGRTGNKNRYSRYTYEFLGSFDTLIQFVGYAGSEEDFARLARKGQVRFEELHKLFDKYNDYPGVSNIKTINDKAGIMPVAVSREIIDLILLSKEWYGKTGGMVNIALGPVLEIWEDYREMGTADPEQARLPGLNELKAANAYTDLTKVQVDRDKRTVYLTETGMSLDMGAVAKGYATELVARELEEAGADSMLINSGGNVRLIGKPLDGIRNKWGIGIQDPNGNPLNPNGKTLDTIFTTGQSVVSSGDYQRYYKVEGQPVHHLIDPRTLFPAPYYRAVTVMFPDSGVADVMSTALFLLSFEESRAMAEGIDGLEALWVFSDGRIEVTAGMKKALEKLGGAASK